MVGLIYGKFRWIRIVNDDFVDFKTFSLERV